MVGNILESVPPMRALLFFAALGAFAAEADFTRDVQPVFRKRCSGCHGASLQNNGFRLDHGPSALKGGYSGPAILPGDSAKSPLIERITSSKDNFKMPPAGPRLTEAEIAAIRSWIDAGAKWPATSAAAPRRTSSHWAFQPIRRPATGKSIDDFILARLNAEGIAPSPEAPKTTLLRRLSLDLTGLPPTPEEVRAFLTDSAPGAYERAVDRLLASRHYGEKWARHWLDLAHYADSDGYEKDLSRPHAWRFRQWVIDALNADMPFDRFTAEQLAGDLLPDRSTDTLIATGFLRQALKNREAGVDREEARFEELVNLANTVSTTWLGLTLGCAQCHDHKYDPLSQRDYYALLSYFERTEEDLIEAPLGGEMGPYLAALPDYRHKRAELLAKYEVPQLLAQWEDFMRQAISHPGKIPEYDFQLTSMTAMVDGARKILAVPHARRSPRDRERIEDYFIRSASRTPGMDQAKMERIKELRKELDALEKSLPRPSMAMIVRDDPAAPPTLIRVKGQWNRKGIPVQAAAPEVLGAAPPPTRLDLARWLASKDNPLTARVIANRVWQEYFGRGLVRTSEDFGVMGEKPSHPELLDFLASEFRDNGWSLKKLHRAIVTSAAYKRSSTYRPDLAQRDPENALLARQQRLRLSAETLRDAALRSSGLLNTQIGGPSFKPPQPAGVESLTYANNNKWIVSTGPERYRRGLYIHFQRTAPYPMLMNFDSPDSTVACSRRARSNTPLQALNLLNDEVFYEAAQALAWRAENEAPKGEQVSYAALLVWGREPTERERARLAQLEDLTSIARALFNTDEFIVRE